MRKLAQKLREETEDLEENKVDVRREDKTIRKFIIPAQDIAGPIITITSVTTIKNHEPVVRPLEMIIRKRQHVLVSGPNGIGKSTFLRTLVTGKNSGAKILEGVKIGYYSQDFATLDFNQTVFDSLESVLADGMDTQEMRTIAGGFLITGELMGRQIAELSEGQKGLLSFARLVVMQPGLLILDEPTNHINFRHIPVIAKAIDDYEGPFLLVSHMPDFVKELRIDDYLELAKI